MRILVVCIFLGLNAFSALTQCDEVLVSGKVEDTLRPQSFYNLMVINRTTGRGVFGRPNGAFSVYASPGDSIALSVRGYPLITVCVIPDSNCQFNNTYFIENKILDVEEVVVRPLKSLEQIRAERESLAMRETRQVTGIDVLQSPITALYQAFSRKEQSKRWVAAQEYKDDQRRIVKELLRNYVAYEIVDLTEEEFDEFISFLNIDENFLKTASEMELITFIKDKYVHFDLFGSQR
jgi:hypothetical protein